MSTPLYNSRVSSQGLGSLQVVPQSQGQETGQAVARFGQQMQSLGQSVGAIGIAQQRVNQQTTLADRTGKYLNGIDQLDQEFKNDPDPVTAPQRFIERADKLREQSIDGLGPEDKAELNLKLIRTGLSYTSDVKIWPNSRMDIAPISTKNMRMAQDAMPWPQRIKSASPLPVSWIKLWSEVSSKV
jgi:hypothetical protein